jgi:hypothetical protein
VPWCNSCDHYLSPSTVRADGTCPTCGNTVDAGEVATEAAALQAQKEEEPLPPIPWHLKLLAVGIAVYLSYRLYQGIVWVLS